jgi:hypothetical protein
MSHFGQQVKQCCLFFSGCVEEGVDVPFRDDQGVAGGDGETVGDGDGVSVGKDNSGVIRIAEGAG